MQRNTLVTLMLVIAAALLAIGPLCSWIDMERPSLSKAISHVQGAALFSLGNASLTGNGILCVVRRATQGKLRARVRQERGDRGRLPRPADRNGRTSWAAKLSTNVNGVVIKKKARRKVPAACSDSGTVLSTPSRECRRNSPGSMFDYHACIDPDNGTCLHTTC